ncbi:MAG: hypothetical protein K0Q95_1052 [Bacteroidota bacterium]|jgi:light-regulated signal transduction histidine kinase (bacteriophytochrome)|nr:hypothetical protein [Bacteroidota bacterium]
MNEKKVRELLEAHNNLILLHRALLKCAEELSKSNSELVFEQDEKEKRAEELIDTNAELQKANDYQDLHVGDMEDLMFVISHKIRQPVAHLLGIANLLELENDAIEMKKMLGMIKKSALELDRFTEQLSDMIHRKKK